MISPNLLRSLVSPAVAPLNCAVCGTITDSGFPLCHECLERVYYAIARRGLEGRCACCGKPLVSAIDRCVTCREAEPKPILDGMLPLFAYSPAGQELLTRWKISGSRGLSEPFSNCLAYALKVIALKDCAVIPVPPRPGKLREKGWDQMEELAGFLERVHGFRVERPLTRSVTVQQKKLGHEARMRNLKGAIRCAPGKALPPVVWVIDDLVATGSTIAACAEALKGAGVGKVYGLALFYD